MGVGGSTISPLEEDEGESRASEGPAPGATLVRIGIFSGRTVKSPLEAIAIVLVILVGTVCPRSSDPFYRVS